MRVDYDLIGSPTLINGYISHGIGQAAFGKQYASAAVAAASVSAAASARDSETAPKSASKLRGERGLTRTATTLLDCALTQDELRRLEDARRAQQRAVLEIAKRKERKRAGAGIGGGGGGGGAEQSAPAAAPPAAGVARAPDEQDDRVGEPVAVDDGDGERGDDPHSDVERSDSPPFVRVYGSEEEEATEGGDASNAPNYDDDGGGGFSFYERRRGSAARKAAGGGGCTTAACLRPNKSDTCLCGEGAWKGKGETLARSYSTQWTAAAAGVGDRYFGVQFGDGAVLQNLYPSLSHVRLPGGKVERIDLYFSRVLRDDDLFREVASLKPSDYEAWARTTAPRTATVTAVAATSKELPRERMESKSIGPSQDAVRAAQPLNVPGGRGRLWGSSSELLGKVQAFRLSRMLGYVDENGKSVYRRPAVAVRDGGHAADDDEALSSDDEEYQQSGREAGMRGDNKSSATTATDVFFATSAAVDASSCAPPKPALSSGGGADDELDRSVAAQPQSPASGAHSSKSGAATERVSGSGGGGVGSATRSSTKPTARERSRSSEVRAEQCRLAVVTLREVSSSQMSVPTSGRRLAAAARSSAPPPLASSLTAAFARAAAAGEPSSRADVTAATSESEGSGFGGRRRPRFKFVERRPSDVAAAVAGKASQPVSLPPLTELASGHAAGSEPVAAGARSSREDAEDAADADKHYGRFSNPVCLCPKLSKETLSCMSSLRPFASSGLLSNGHLFKCQLHARYA